MSTETVVGGVIAASLAGYLVVAWLFPERF
ncbi:K(+)-transporting ATPase subunit F [Streptomyces sp. NPDC002054]